MSRALVALDAQRVELTDGTDADLAALLVEVVSAQPLAGPWKEARIGFSPTWSREVIVRTARGAQFPGLVEAEEADGEWKAAYRVRIDVGYGFATYHPSPEAARAACDERLRALGWLLL